MPLIPGWCRIRSPTTATIENSLSTSTGDARSILKERVLMADAVRQNANLAALVAGLLKSDQDLIARSLADHLIEPTRKLLIPEFDRVDEASRSAGALGGGIAGSGPLDLHVQPRRTDRDGGRT